jgi:hypothetical protein
MWKPISFIRTENFPETSKVSGDHHELDLTDHVFQIKDTDVLRRAFGEKLNAE